jgi:hypothetical protein
MKIWGIGAAAAVLTVTGFFAGQLPAGAVGGTTAKLAPAEVRVDQVGYAAGASKAAFVMLPGRVRSVSFTVWSTRGPVLRGTSRRYAGAWNANYKAVYELDFSGLRHQGKYRITATASGQTGRSPWFRIATPASLYQSLVSNAVRYFTSERDGADVVHSVLSREPANLTDEHATVYASPKYDANDNLLGTFRKIGGPVNVSGGWFDAGGGYEKFAYTASYAEGLLLLADRENPARYATLGPESQFGLNWLEKLWNPKKKVLYIQVGIGTGNASNTIHGDYNFWFLPQAEDRMNVSKGGNPGPTARYVKYRPVFAAAMPGHKVSPDFGGRFAADFGLGAQLAARSGPPAAAARLLALARGIYAMALTTNVKSIVTVYPHDFYPGSEWKSMMLWGAAEIALADEAVHAPRAQLRHDLAVAARWARAYIAQGHPAGSDTLNLYDNGAIGEAELLVAMRHEHGPAVISRAALLADMAAQLRLGERAARGDPFGLGSALGASDASPHAFGLYITNALYQRLSGSARYAAFAQQQLNFALGSNGWGSSFVVGAGSTFPHCMQSEIANLAGSLTGHGNIQLGAVTDGPSGPDNFQGLGTVDGMRACSAGKYRPFDTKAARYEDNVVSWPSVEPADDYTANSLLAFALAAR